MTNEKPQMVVLCDISSAEFSRRVLWELDTFGRAVVLSVETEDRRMEEARDALARIAAETQEAVSPTPKSRHERRAAAAKARKGGGR